MDQEKFVNQYIELLNATVAESIQKNLILQTQKKIAEVENSEFREALRTIGADKDREIDSLKTQLNQSRRQEAISGNEKEELRRSIQHVDTFKNELLKTRAENEELLAIIKQKDKEIEKLKGKDQSKIEEKEIEKVKVKEQPKIEAVDVQTQEKPKDVGNTWVKKVPAKKKTTTKNLTIKDAGEF
jgi:exonuclease SbcC